MLSRRRLMPPRTALSVTLLSTWVLFFGFVLLGWLVSPVAWVLTSLWALLLVGDLHVALPEEFFETEQDAFRYVGASFVFKVAAFALAQLGALAAWVGSALLVPTGGGAVPVALWVLVSLPGLVVYALLVRHILSALATLADGGPQVVGWIEVAVNVLLPPLFVLSSHYHARKHLGI